MKDMISNCYQSRSHYTYLLRQENGRIVSVEKKSFDKGGVDALSRETEGLKWYCRQTGSDPSDIIEDFESNQAYCRLKTKYINGEILSAPVPPDSVKNKIRMAVDHYLTVFGKDNFEYSHGDYFIGNIIFKNDKITGVIDWEHFNDRLPAGYDAVNLIVEVFLSSYSNNISHTESSVHAARCMLKHISEKIALPDTALKQPSLWCRDTALSHKEIWGPQYNKLPHIACSYQTCLKIDGLLGL